MEYRDDILSFKQVSEMLSLHGIEKQDIDEEAVEKLTELLNFYLSSNTINEEKLKDVSVSNENQIEEIAEKLNSKPIISTQKAIPCFIPDAMNPKTLLKDIYV